MKLSKIRQVARTALSLLLAAGCALPAGAGGLSSDTAGPQQPYARAEVLGDRGPSAPTRADAARAETPPLIGDVRLHGQGVFFGQVVTREYAPVEGQAVTLVNADRALATARTDARGYFAFRGLKNGVYQVAVNGSRRAYRVWTAQTAPPAAQPGALIVMENEVVRGQQGGAEHVLKGALNNPFIVGGVVAAAVAVPIAVHNARDEQPASP